MNLDDVEKLLAADDAQAAKDAERGITSRRRSAVELENAMRAALPSLIASARRVEEYRSALEVALAILSTPDTEEGAVSRVARAELVVFKALQQPPTAKE